MNNTKGIVQALQRQMDLNRSKNMLYAQLGQVIEIDSDFLATLESLLANDEQALSGLPVLETISSASRMLLQRLYSINQFLRVDEQNTQRLEEIYLSTWEKILETRDIQATLQDHHYPELARWLADLYPPHLLKQLRNAPTIGNIVCEEYSPQLQVRLLGIEIHTLKQPLLDIGCGCNARLVRYLRARHIEAYGIDRQIDIREGYLHQIDWFNYSFQPESWGTITSNMAFTNHLLYTYHHDAVQFKLYLKKFDEILASLKMGSSLYYAPGIPFLEHALPTDKYQVQCSNITKEISMTRITKLVT